MAFDRTISSAGRLQILTALATDDGQEFSALRRLTRLTDGNLSAHARRLNDAGYVLIEKEFRVGKPLTTFHLTAAGREALRHHATAILAAVSRPAEQQPAPAPQVEVEVSADTADDWVD